MQEYIFATARLTFDFVVEHGLTRAFSITDERVHLLALLLMYLLVEGGRRAIASREPRNG